MKYKATHQHTSSPATNQLAQHDRVYLVGRGHPWIEVKCFALITS